MHSKKPIRLYKFLSRRYADDMVRRGIIRIGTAEEYRVPDGRTGARSDAAELSRRWQPGDVTIEVDHNHPFVQQIFKGNPPEMKSPIQMKFDAGAVLVSSAHAWIYSTSSNLSDALRKRMATDFDADACIRINDASEFARTIATHEKFSTLHWYGAYVRYVPSYDEKEYSVADPFTKLNEFRWQKEFRLIWEDNNASGDGVVIEVPAITSSLRRMY